MSGAALLPFATWQNFYVIVAAAVPTMTGLMFVVILADYQLVLSDWLWYTVLPLVSYILTSLKLSWSSVSEKNCIRNCWWWNESPKAARSKKGHMLQRKVMDFHQI
jgi:hypothetical protein